MKVRFWGTRGSIATPGPETTRYGGETSCVEVVGAADHALVLDAGTGIRRLGAALGPNVRQIDLLLTHLHLDHIVGLGFFGPLFQPDTTVRIWAQHSPSGSFLERLGRYLSPPLFPVRVRDFGANVELRETPIGPFQCGPFQVVAEAVIHPDPALGFRVSEGGSVLSYIPDHEPRLGGPWFARVGEWTSGWAIATGADLLIHDAQYTSAEYAERVGWGHSAVSDAVTLAEMAGARRLALFHHDPGHDDDTIDALLADARLRAKAVEVFAAVQGDALEVRAADALAAEVCVDVY
jgi:phosphoribosyl 1,2-cyclic phosphodiesterase